MQKPIQKGWNLTFLFRKTTKKNSPNTKEKLLVCSWEIVKRILFPPKPKNLIAEVTLFEAITLRLVHGYI